MSFILNIDTALETAMVSLASNGSTVQIELNHQQKDHASWLHPAIEKVMQNAGIGFHNLHAVAVNIGPGSYTGLRVGLSAAKGFCYTMQIPLITISSLQLLAASVIQFAEDLICPLIDARRLEMYAAVYDKELNEVLPPHILTAIPTSFQDIIQKHPVLFCGNGQKKLQQVIEPHKNVLFSNHQLDPDVMGILSNKRFNNNEFASLALSEPLYLKDFYSAGRKY